MKNTIKILCTFLFMSIILPNFAFAYWWNPISWFNNGKKIENIIPALGTTTIRLIGSEAATNTSDVKVEDLGAVSIDVKDKEIIELKKQISSLLDEILVLKKSGLNTREIIKEVPVEKIVYQDKIVEKLVSPNCPICPVSQEPSQYSEPKPIQTPKPLTATCTGYPNPAIQKTPTKFTVTATGGDGVYYYSWGNSEFINLSSCGNTTDPTCSTSCFGLDEFCSKGQYSTLRIPFTNAGGQLGNAIVNVSSGSQSIRVLCSDLYLSR